MSSTKINLGTFHIVAIGCYIKIDAAITANSSRTGKC